MIKARKGMAWKACNKMDQIWKSNLNRNLKIRLLTSTVEVFYYIAVKHEA